MEGSDSEEILTEPSRAFGEFFWRKIEEDLKIYVILKKRPTKQLKLYPIEEQDLGIDLPKVKLWSVDNEKLYNDIRENGYADFICNQENLVETYREILFNGKKINQMDKELLRFKNLKQLYLNENQIEKLENIPEKLQQLYLFRNGLSKINPKIRSTNLIFLGLGHNRLTDVQLNGLAQNCPQLLAVDLSFNELSEIDLVVDNLISLKNLKMLSLFGNPLCLLENYRKAMLNEFQMLHYFDEVRVYDENFDQDGNPIQRPQIQQQTNIPESNESDIDQSPQRRGSQGHIQVFELEGNPKSNLYQFGFVLNVQTLEMPPGFALEKSSFPEDKYNQDPTRFQTCYWIKFQILDQTYDGKQLKQIQKFEDLFKDQDEKTRLDMQVNFETTLNISIQTRDFFFKGFLIYLYKSEPRLVKLAQDQDPTPQLSEIDGLPIVEESVQGIVKIQLKDWLYSTASPRIISQKYQIFDPSLQNSPEFLYPPENEQQLVEDQSELYQKLVQAREDALKPPEQDTTNKKDNKKQAKDAKKKDDKKNSKTTKKGAKDANEPEEKTVPLLDWPKEPRKAVYLSPKSLALPQKDVLLAVQTKIQ